MDISKIAKVFKSSVIDNSPLILTYLSVAGVLTTAILAVRGTPRAMDELQYAMQMTDNRKLTPKEIVLATYKPYMPAAISGVMTIGCILGASNISNRRNAALVTVYSLTETALKEYQAKVKEQYGESKEKKIRSDIAKDHIDNAPMATAEVFITGLGEQLCYDSFTGRYFKSDIETIRKAQNDINAKLFQDMYASHNDFYKLIGLSKTSFGEEVGWTLDQQMDIEFTSHLADDGRPCLCIEYRTSPKTGYYEFG